MKLCALALVVVAVASAAMAARPRWSDLDASYSFEQYKADFGKKYALAEEHTMRAAVFAKNLAKILRHNSDTTKTWKEGVNHLTDRTPEEFKKMLGYRKDIGYNLHQEHEQISAAAAAEMLAAAPAEVDWRPKGVVSAVKDQGECGSCWAFAATETIESQFARLTGELPVLSVQNILDCTPNPKQCGGTGGCAGGTAEVAYDVLETLEITSEWQYPYNSYFGHNFKCAVSGQVMAVAKITNYTKLPSNEYAPLLDALANVGPIAISVEASTWQHYESGVFDGCNKTNPDLDHAVQVVGYGGTGAEAYWTVRNSWSPAWGELGYIRLRRVTTGTPECGTDITPLDGDGCKGGPKTQHVCGTCGILFDTCYPGVAPA